MAIIGICVGKIYCYDWYWYWIGRYFSVSVEAYPLSENVTCCLVAGTEKLGGGGGGGDYSLVSGCKQLVWHPLMETFAVRLFAIDLHATH